MIKLHGSLALLLSACSQLCLADVVHASGFELEKLPENAVSVSVDKRVEAFYAKPTQKYQHGILGDTIEAQQLVVRLDNQVYQHTLAVHEVFEDIRPRLFDVDNDGTLEFITIRTDVDNGAGIAIYKLIDNQLREYARVPTIGLRNRWLNIAAIADLDNDGTVEIAWVQTPHIGGILKVARIRAGILTPVAAAQYYSNHAIGERNLCLSVIVTSGNDTDDSDNDSDSKSVNATTLYLPNQSRTSIVGFRFIDNQLRIVDEIEQKVDFAKPLALQYRFDNIIKGEDNCM